MSVHRKTKLFRELAGINLNDDVLYTSDEVFPESTPGMTLQGFRGREEMTQEELAKSLGVTQGRISALEGGTRPISMDMSKRLGKFFNVTYKVFL